MYAGVCRQCRGDHHRTVGSIETASDVQDPGPAPTSHPGPLIHEPSCSAESAKEIVELPQLPPATEESEQLSADPVLHVRFQEDLISEVSSSSLSKGWGVCVPCFEIVARIHRSFRTILGKRGRGQLLLDVCSHIYLYRL